MVRITGQEGWLAPAYGRVAGINTGKPRAGASQPSRPVIFRNSLATLAFPFTHHALTSD
ncbi:MAG: hypothetical protein AABN33_15425 [Acidobacteriota bacterium]